MTAEDLPKEEVTALLNAWNEGDPRALERLAPWMYPELRRLARRFRRKEHDSFTLQATELAHEVYVLLDRVDVRWQTRSHFSAMVARLLRRFLVDRARAAKAQKRGGGEKAAEVERLESVGEPGLSVDVLALDEALGELAAFDPRKTEILEMKFFAGMTREEIAEAQDISVSTVERDLRLARSWLHRRLSEA